MLDSQVVFPDGEVRNCKISRFPAYGREDIVGFDIRDCDFGCRNGCTAGIRYGSCNCASLRLSEERAHAADRSDDRGAENSSVKQHSLHSPEFRWLEGDPLPGGHRSLGQRRRCPRVKEVYITKFRDAPVKCQVDHSQQDKWIWWPGATSASMGV